MLQSRLQIPSNNLLAVVLLYMLASNLLLLLWATTQNGVAASNGAGAIEVAYFGPIKKIIAPPGWTKFDDSDAIKIALELEPKTQREVRIGLLSWRRGISEQSWAYFKALIIANSNLNSSRLLFTDKGLPDAKAIENVKALTRVLGINHAGDNQITNSRKPPDPQAPVFHLERLSFNLSTARLSCSPGAISLTFTASRPLSPLESSPGTKEIKLMKCTKSTCKRRTKRAYKEIGKSSRIL